VKPRRQTIRLKHGDVRALRIYRGKHAFRLVIYDGDTAVPLIQAKLKFAESQALRWALAGRGDRARPSKAVPEKARERLPLILAKVYDPTPCISGRCRFT